MTASKLVLTVDEKNNGLRLDACIASLSELSRSAASRLCEEGRVTVNGKSAGKKQTVRAGDTIEIDLPEVRESEAKAEDLPLEIVFEDADLLVVNKPQGMVVHPAPGNEAGTLVNALLHHCGDSLSGVGGVKRPGIVHRIDKDTSGLLVVAKNDETHKILSAGLKDHAISRIYTAIAVGNFKEDEGKIDAPIGRHPTDRKKMAIVKDPNRRARNAVTHWKVLARGSANGQSFTLLRCELETGRTHQIRVHLASLGHPILGDPIYGGNHTKFEATHKSLISGQTLHAGELHFTHPKTGKEMTFTAEPPKEFAELERLLFEKE